MLNRSKIALFILLIILCLNVAYAQSASNVLIILDCSMSMDEKINGQKKIDIAKGVINQVLSEIPPDVNVGLRVYGHKRDALKSFVGMDKCEISDLLVPIMPNSRRLIFEELSKLRPVGWTPICYSLEQASVNDFQNLTGKKRIILVSDGMETCGGNPCEKAVELVREHADISIDVIGFDLSTEPAALNNLRCVALSTRGKFYIADNPREFLNSMRQSFSVSTDIQGKVLY